MSESTGGELNYRFINLIHVHVLIKYLTTMYSYILHLHADNFRCLSINGIPLQSFNPAGNHGKICG